MSRVFRGDFSNPKKLGFDNDFSKNKKSRAGDSFGIEEPMPGGHSEPQLETFTFYDQWTEPKSKKRNTKGRSGDRSRIEIGQPLGGHSEPKLSSYTSYDPFTPRRHQNGQGDSFNKVKPKKAY